MLATDHERATTFFYSGIRENHPAFGLPFVLSFNTILAAAIARTDCSRISACADNRHRRRYNSNSGDRANESFENALGRDSRQSFARSGYQSCRLVRVVTRECGWANTPWCVARLSEIAPQNRR